MQKPPLYEAPGRCGTQWQADREAEMLPVPYFYVVFTFPPGTAEIAFQKKALVSGLLMRSAAQALSLAYILFNS